MRTSPALDAFLAHVARRLGDRVRTDAEALAAAGVDESHEPAGQAAAVLVARSTDEVAVIAREAAERQVGLVPRGAGTGKSGGCIPAAGQVVVDVSGMNRLLRLRPEDLCAEVEPGLITAQLDAAAAEHGLMYPPDPASWESCSLGGNISTNAGGPRAVKYGVTRRYVWGVEVVLAGGDVLRLGRHCIKGVAGLEMGGLFVGAEGTLGIVTAATMHLVPSPRGVQTAWLSFADPQAASAAASRIFAGGILPRMLELVDGPALAAVAAVAPFALPAGPGIGAALLVETDAADEQLAEDELVRLCELADAPDAILARSEGDREAMRRTRRLVSSQLKAAYPFKISDDIAVPRSQMPGLLVEAHRLAAAAGLTASAYGHLGDGNLHVNLLCRSAAERAAAQPAREALWRWGIAHEGTVSGEHGIGTSKRAALALEQPAVVRRWQDRIKATFDPSGIMNPGKIYQGAAVTAVAV